MMRPRGQATVEYTLLLCVVLTMFLLIAGFLQTFGRELVERVGERLLEAVFVLGRP